MRKFRYELPHLSCSPAGALTILLRNLIASSPKPSSPWGCCKLVTEVSSHHLEFSLSTFIRPEASAMRNLCPTSAMDVASQHLAQLESLSMGRLASDYNRRLGVPALAPRLELLDCN
eukprot:gb/GECG01015233.1/.p1 GENE.gb/GECG01015233.1/~~gb/GECG01015233.1/.p1  ORF type:complete len:117 (+),score=9.10 gb/GECG01015233.1/:1-351(+)